MSNDQLSGGFSSVLGAGRGRGQRTREPFDPTGLSEQQLDQGERWMVVGVSFYQQQLAAILREPDAGNTWTARLLPEPDNRHDPSAVAVEINGQIIGHLKREQARHWQPRLLALAAQGKLATATAQVQPAVRIQDNEEIIVVRINAVLAES
jgi:hypothetical protein